jgi:hypothetical protein
MNPPTFDWFSLFPLNTIVYGLVKLLPPIFYEVVRLFPRIMASNESFGIVIQKQSEIITDICQGQTVTEAIQKKLENITARYILLQKQLQKHCASYMLFCLGYEEVQNHLLANAECLEMTKNIVWNAVILVQCLRFIKNRERFSPNDILTDEKNILESNHNLSFMGYGVDDFMSKEKRRLPIFDWFEKK